MSSASDQAAANRELTARISRLVWVGRIVSVVVALALAATVFVVFVDLMPAMAGRQRRGGRVNTMLLLVATGAAFAVPFLALRALFRWILAARRKAWIRELAAKHGVDAERLRRVAEAISELP